jgi:hypothetical protein
VDSWERYDLYLVNLIAQLLLFVKLFRDIRGHARARNEPQNFAPIGSLRKEACGRAHVAENQ